MKKDRQKYDDQKWARACTSAAVRAVVAGYIAWLGVKIIRGVKAGGTTVPPAVGWIAGIVFIAAALAFCFYIWKRLRAELDAARISPDQETESAGAEDPDA